MRRHILRRRRQLFNLQTDRWLHVIMLVLVRNWIVLNLQPYLLQRWLRGWCKRGGLLVGRERLRRNGWGVIGLLILPSVILLLVIGLLVLLLVVVTIVVLVVRIVVILAVLVVVVSRLRLLLSSLRRHHVLIAEHLGRWLGVLALIVTIWRNYLIWLLVVAYLMVVLFHYVVVHFLRIFIGVLVDYDHLTGV